MEEAYSDNGFTKSCNAIQLCKSIDILKHHETKRRKSVAQVELVFRHERA